MIGKLSLAIVLVVTLIALGETAVGVEKTGNTNLIATVTEDCAITISQTYCEFGSMTPTGGDPAGHYEKEGGTVTVYTNFNAKLTVAEPGDDGCMANGALSSLGSPLVVEPNNVVESSEHVKLSGLFTQLVAVGITGETASITDIDYEQDVDWGDAVNTGGSVYAITVVYKVEPVV